MFANFIGTEISYSPKLNDSIKLIPVSGNGLINTINICYGQHRPLVLSPDIIWMTIAQGVTTHINKNYKELESKLFKYNKPKKIKVRNDSLEFGSKHWQNLISNLSDSTKRYTQSQMHTFLAPIFSTTTQDIYTAYEANILYGYKKAFTYVGEGGCGIRYITLTGKKADWIQIKESLKTLDEINLKYWRMELEPILDEFISVYDNNTNTLFWRNMYKEFMNYGAFSISGWIIKFYPYMEVLGDGGFDEETQMMKINHEFVENKFIYGDKYLFSTLNIDDFPNYKSEANILWINHFKGEATQMSLYSGIMGAKQYSDGSLKPYITWAICSEKEPKASTLWTKSNEVIHKDPDWIPYVYNNDSKLTKKAIYPVKNNINFQESLTTFKEQITPIIPLNSNSDTLVFYILSSGKPLIINDDENLKVNVQSWIDKNGIVWEPAKIKLVDVFYFGENIDTSKLVRVNSKFELYITK